MPSRASHLGNAMASHRKFSAKRELTVQADEPTSYHRVFCALLLCNILSGARFVPLFPKVPCTKSPGTMLWPDVAARHQRFPYGKTQCRKDSLCAQHPISRPNPREGVLYAGLCPVPTCGNPEVGNGCAFVCFAAPKLRVQTRVVQTRIVPARVAQRQNAHSTFRGVAQPKVPGTRAAHICVSRLQSGTGHISRPIKPVKAKCA